MKYFYLVSSGEYSSYGVDALAVSDSVIPDDKLRVWEQEINLIKPTPDLAKWLSDKGLTLLYPAGEFNEASYGGVFRFWSEIKEGEENALRIGLA